MNKKEYVRKRVTRDVWDLFSEVYDIKRSKPSSDKQLELLDKMSDYVYEKFATQISRDRLKTIFGDDDGEGNLT